MIVRRATGSYQRALSFLLSSLVLLAASPVFSAPTTSAQAKQAVQGWLKLDAAPLGAAVGKRAAVVQPVRDAQGSALYYVVYLDPSGFVIVPGDDLIEPIVCFVSSGTFDTAPQNCLGALVSKDLPGRMAQARGLAAQGGLNALPSGARDEFLGARDKWARLVNIGKGSVSILSLSNVSDPRISPIIQSQWNQTLTACGYTCYNYYTPSHYPCGCVATATAQIMRLHQFPTAGPGTPCYDIWVSGVPETACLRGGDGVGGPYLWNNMVLVPSCATTLAQRQAIGALCYDAGVAVNMEYAADGSSAWVVHTSERDVVDALKQTFGYANVIGGLNPGGGAGSSLLAMINPNLDAGYPVELAIAGGPGAHAIVADGYGYNASTLYHHLNLGWGGLADAWYNLPTVDTDYGIYTTITACVYNVYVTGAGEIISGRVTNSSGQPLSGATVTATRTGGGTYTATTNSRGIYALPKVPSASNYTVTVQKAGYTFTPRTVSTGTSLDNGTGSGNKWGIDFTGISAAPTCGITFTPASPLRNETVTFDSHAADPDGWVVSVTWSFGDGDTGSGITTTHAYATSGVFTVSCTVTDNSGNTTVCSNTVLVEVDSHDLQWNIGLRLYTGSVGGSPIDTGNYLGVRSGSTDGYDSAYDAAHAPLPQPPYVYLCWNRPAWPNGTEYKCDYRAFILAGAGRTWQDLRAWTSENGASLWLNWVLGAGGTAWQVPADYALTLCDEGTSPNPSGGSPLDMRSGDRLNFISAALPEIHYFHIVVRHGPAAPPTCNITLSPDTPTCQQTVAFDSQASDPGDPMTSVSWTFGDGTTGSGVTTSHAYAGPGTYDVTCTVTNGDGLTADCATSVTVSSNLIEFTLGPACWHLFSLPCDPINPAPEAVFPPGTPLSGNLTRYEPGGYVTYSEFDPPEVFGPMQAGAGYWFYASDIVDVNISYEACCPPEPRELRYPVASWYLIGGPQPTDVSLIGCSVRDNSTGETQPFEQAWIAGWVQNPLFSYSCADLSYLSCGVDFGDQDDHLREWQGYWFHTGLPDLTLVVPPW